MYQTNYMNTKDGRRIPYIEKDGLRVVAVPKGFDLTERVGEEIANRTLTPLPHPGYNLRFPTNLSLADCLRLVKDYLDPTEIAMRFERNGILVLVTNFLPEKINLVLSKGSKPYHDDELLQEYRRVLKSLQPKLVVTNQELTHILDSSKYICYQIAPIDEDFVPKAGTFPSFWYETDFEHEDGTPSARVVQATALSFDEKIFQVLSRASALKLGEEEMAWIKRLFSVEVRPIVE